MVPHFRHGRSRMEPVSEGENMTIEQSANRRCRDSRKKIGKRLRNTSGGVYEIY